MSNKIKLIFKLTFSIVIFTLVLARIDLESVGDLLSQARIQYLVLAVISYFVFNFGCSYRFHFLIKKIVDNNIGFMMAIKLYFLGIFFNLFLPTTIGGDSIKILRLADSKVSKKKAAATVLADRFFGFIGLISLLLFSSGKLIKIFGISQTQRNTFIIIGVTLSIITLFILRTKKLQRVSKSIKDLGLRKVLLLTFYSVALQLVSILTLYLTFHSLGVAITYSDLLVTVPIINLILVLPISFQGIGIREITSIGLYAFFGISSDEVIATNMLLYGMLIIGAIFGAIINSFDGLQTKLETTKN